MFAHAWEGAPLTRQHGGPVRLVLPKLYFWKSPNWVTRVELLADPPGVLEVRGYHYRAIPGRRSVMADASRRAVLAAPLL